MKVTAGALLLLLMGGGLCAAEPTTIYVRDSKGMPADKAVVYLLAPPNVRVPDDKNRIADIKGVVVYEELDPKYVYLKVVIEHKGSSAVVLIESKGIAFPKSLVVELKPPRPER